MKNNMDKNKIYGKANYNEDIVKLVKILVVVVVCLGIVYFATAIATGEISFKDKETVEEEITIQYDEIIAGEILNRKKSDYYVLLFKFTDDKGANLISYNDLYKKVTGSLPVYLVDLDKGFNSVLSYDENDKIEELPNNINNLKVNDTTLLKIKDGKVISRVTTYEKVETEFNNLTK